MDQETIRVLLHEQGQAIWLLVKVVTAFLSVLGAMTGAGCFFMRRLVSTNERLVHVLEEIHGRTIPELSKQNELERQQCQRQHQIEMAAIQGLRTDGTSRHTEVMKRLGELS